MGDLEGDFGASSPSEGGSTKAGAWLDVSTATSPEASVLLSSCSLDSVENTNTHTHSYSHIHCWVHTTHAMHDESEPSQCGAMNPQERERDRFGLRTISMSRKQHRDVRNRETGKDIDFRGQRLSQKHKKRLFE